jgi:hypothetical protein
VICGSWSNGYRESAGEAEIFPWRDVFSDAFAQCEWEGRFGAIRRGGHAEPAYCSLCRIQSFRTVLAQSFAAFIESDR